MGIGETRQRAVVRACSILGDETALAERLGVPVSEVVGWILGDAHVPTEHFLRVVDIVLVDNRNVIESTAEFLSQVRERHRR